MTSKKDLFVWIKPTYACIFCKANSKQTSFRWACLERFHILNRELMQIFFSYSSLSFSAQWGRERHSSITAWICNFLLSFAEPRTEILGDQELFVDYASSLNLTCLVISPNPPAFVFWKLTDKVQKLFLAMDDLQFLLKHIDSSSW